MSASTGTPPGTFRDNFDPLRRLTFWVRGAVRRVVLNSMVEPRDCGGTLVREFHLRACMQDERYSASSPTPSTLLYLRLYSQSNPKKFNSWPALLARLR
jgi:hypothetical protein